MPVSLTTTFVRAAASAALTVGAAAALAGATPALAQSASEAAYIAQAGNAASRIAAPTAPATPTVSVPLLSRGYQGPTTATPENSARGNLAALSSGNNRAQSFQIGNDNHIAHIQAGASSQSLVGVIGNENRIGVLQGGNNLRSNIVLVGTQGLNVGVLQPSGSAPVNVLIARLPNGGLLIKR